MNAINLLNAEFRLIGGTKNDLSISKKMYFIIYFQIHFVNLKFSVFVPPTLNQSHQLNKIYGTLYQKK